MGGADLLVDGHLAVIEGVDHLNGAPVKATDLRAGVAMLIAGLCAHGTTQIEDIFHIERGYECVMEKNAGVGSRYKRVSVPEPAIPAGYIIQGFWRGKEFPFFFVRRVCF